VTVTVSVTDAGNRPSGFAAIQTRSRARERLALIAMLAVLVTSCGYKFGRGPRGLPGVQTIAIPPFEEVSSFELGAGAVLAAALRRAVLASDGLQLADSEVADARVEGRVLKLRASSIAYPTGVDPGEISVGEYRLDVAVDVKVVRRSDGKVLFREKRFSGLEEYLAGAEPIATTENRRQALQRLADRLMADLHDLMLQGF